MCRELKSLLQSHTCGRAWFSNHRVCSELVLWAATGESEPPSTQRESYFFKLNSLKILKDQNISLFRRNITLYHHIKTDYLHPIKRGERTLTLKLVWNSQHLGGNCITVLKNVWQNMNQISQKCCDRMLVYKLRYILLFSAWLTYYHRQIYDFISKICL